MRISSLRSWTVAAVGAATAMLCSVDARAAAINYGNSAVLPPGAQFENMTESSGTDAVPLYGAPSYFSVGADFEPTSLVASAAGGGIDVTDGQLNFTLDGSHGLSLFAIDSLSLFEAGDFTLLGTGTAGTSVSAGANIRIAITEIDGVAVLGAPIMLTPSGASFSANLVANPGMLQPWSIGTSVNIATQLDALNIDYEYGATEIEVVIDNELVAFSQPTSSARIAKKDFVVEADGTAVAVPEPATVSILALGFAGVLMRRRGR